MSKIMLTLLNPKPANGRSQNLKSRQEIDDASKWRTDHIFASNDDWETAFDGIQEDMDQLDQYRGQLGESAGQMLKCFQIRDRIEITLGNLSLYANLKGDEDTRVSKFQAYRERIANLISRVRQKEAFIYPEIISLPKAKIWEFIHGNRELAVYEHYLRDILRSKNHILNKDGEHLLALAGEMAGTPYQVFSMFNNADIKFPEVENEQGTRVEVTKGNFSVLIRSANRRVRKNTFLAFYNTYNDWKNTLSANLSGAIRKNIFFAKARNYRNALEGALDSDNIPTAVYDNVIEAVNKNIEPMHKYINLRKRLLKLDRVQPWDLYVPLLTEMKWKVPYPQAVETIKKALQPLGDDYLRAMENGFQSGWIDVFENQGKRSGAYSNASYGIAHPYILLNYNETLDDMFTVAHEMGHAMHSYYTMRTQPYIYSEYTIFVAEVASTLNESLLIDYLLKNTTDKDKKLYLLNHYIDQIRGTVYIQTIFAEFEKSIHEKAEAGEALTAESLNRLAREIYARYYGPDFELDSIYDVNWCRIPHFYYDFYVWQYATGFSAATALSRKILAGDIPTRDAYLRFLSRGSSDYSINLLRDAGVDMTSPVPIEATARLFAKLIDEMENLLGE